MFVECVASGSESQTSSRTSDQAKYAVLTCARPFGDTVAIAQSVDASSSAAARLRRRAELIRRLDRLTPIELRCECPLLSYSPVCWASRTAAAAATASAR